MIPEARLQDLKQHAENTLNQTNQYGQFEYHNLHTENISTQSLSINNTETACVNQTHDSEIDVEINFLNSIDIEALTPTIVNIEHNTTHTVINEERGLELEESFSHTLQHFTNIHPTKRNYIPKQKPSKKLTQMVGYINNVILPKYVNADTDFETLQTVIYSAAWTAAKINGSKLSIDTSENTANLLQKNKKPKWHRRLELKIQDLRGKIGRLTAYMQGNRGWKLVREVNTIIENYKTHTTHEEPNTQLSHFLDTLKQKLTLVNSRLSRYNKCTLRKSQNNNFKNNEKQFYRTLKQATTNQVVPSESLGNSITNLPPIDSLRQFWSGIWERPICHNAAADWITKETENYSHTVQMESEHIPIDTFHEVLGKLHNWKAPGSDYIHNFWYKKLTFIHPHLYNHINIFIQNPTTMPTYIAEGITYMLPKDTSDSSNPAKYRPITCLQTIYKIITSCITHIIYKHLESNTILSEEQKGCRKFSQGCKEQLTIDAVILKQVQRKRKDLYTMYIDYKKAYDSVPHTWLLEVLKIYKINPIIVAFLSNAMTHWTTRLHLTSPRGIVETGPIKIQRGIFQGDSLSPLWFCLALNPLSNRLNIMTPGYNLPFYSTTVDTQTDRQNCKINHLLYMDDIKLYASTPDDLFELAETADQFSTDIRMEFGIDKCKINSVKAGQPYQHSYTLQTGETIDSLNANETYKYLGYIQDRQIKHKDIKRKLTQQFKHRLKSILNTQLYSKHTVKAINTFAIPILTYSFGIISWTKTDLKNLQRVINTTMTKHRKHHPRSCVQRLTLPRKEGGRGIIDITNLHNKQISTLRKYFHTKSLTSSLHKAIVHNDQKLTPLNMHEKTAQINEKQTDQPTKILEWTQKSLHGRHRHDLCQPNVDRVASNEWLRRGDLFPETEGFMTAIQDQVIETRNYQKHIMRVPLLTDFCRRCHSSSETIQHITGACKAIVQTDYKHRHDQIANIIHQKLAIKYNLIPTPPVPYYKYIPETVLENASHKLYFDRAILTDKTTHYNRPDITLLDKINKTAQIIDIAVPNTHNLQSTIAEKLSKYTDLKIEISRMWRLCNVSIIPVVISTTGVIPKHLHKSLKMLDIAPSTYQTLQKAAILNTCRIVRKFLQDDNNADTYSIT